MVSIRGPISEKAFNLIDMGLLGSTTYLGIGLGVSNALGKLDGITDEALYVGGVSFAAYSVLAYVAERGVDWATPDHDQFGDMNRNLLDHPNRFGVRNAIKFGALAACIYAATLANAEIAQYFF